MKCRNCGFSFSEAELRANYRKHSNFIRCPNCGHDNPVELDDEFILEVLL